MFSRRWEGSTISVTRSKATAVAECGASRNSATSSEKIAPHERPQHALMLSIPPPYLDPTSVDQIRFRAREISLMKDHFTGSELLRGKLPDMARHRSTSVAVLAPR